MAALMDGRALGSGVRAPEPGYHHVLHLRLIVLAVEPLVGPVEKSSPAVQVPDPLDQPEQPVLFGRIDLGSGVSWPGACGRNGTHVHPLRVQVPAVRQVDVKPGHRRGLMSVFVALLYADVHKLLRVASW